MERLVAMSRTPMASRNHRSDANGRPPASAAPVGASSSGESSCYASVTGGERYPDPAMEVKKHQGSKRRKLFHRLARHAHHHHSSHPEVATPDRDTTSNGGSNTGLAVFGHPLRASKSLDNVLITQDGKGIAVVKYDVEPGSRRVRSDDHIFQRDHSGSRERSASADADNTDTRNEDEAGPALPARRYLDDGGDDDGGDNDDIGQQPGGAGNEAVNVLRPQPRPEPFVPPTDAEAASAAALHEAPNRPSKLMQDMLALNKCGYYWGPIDEQIAVGVLADAAEGTFLVHDSSHLHHLYAVSVLVSGIVEQFPITSFDNQTGYTFSNPPEQPLHPTPDDIAWACIQPTIPDLIATAQRLTLGTRQRRGVRPYLVKPLNHPYVVPSLQEMCRTALRKDMRLTPGHIRQLPLPKYFQDYLMKFSFF